MSARKVVTRTLIALAGLAVGYLAIANWALSRLENWASSEDLSLRYDGAYSLWPGHLELENFTLRTSDTNVQIELRIAKASVNVSLHELLWRRFHATSVETEGTEFRLRHRVRRLDDHAARVAAYPPISGFEGPPLYEGEASQADSAEEGWSVHLQNVTARVSRLWFVEYDYQGPAVAQGSFELRPGRFIELQPSTLHFQGGALSVGEHPAAEKLEGVLQAQIAPTELSKVEGAAIFEKITAKLDLGLQGGDLAFADVYLKSRLPFTLAGPLAGNVYVALTRGALGPDTRVELNAPDATVRTDSAELEGDLTLGVAVDAGASPDRLRLSVSSQQVTASREPGPRFRDVRGELELQPANVSAPMQRSRLALEVGSVDVADVGWFERLLGDDSVALAGRAQGSLEYVDDEGDGTSGHAHAAFQDLQVATGGAQLALTGKADARFESPEQARLSLAHLHAVVQNGALELDGERWHSWSMELTSRSFRVLSDPTALQTTLDLELTKSGGLVALALPDLPASVATELLGLDALRGRLAFYGGGGLRRVEILKAESGAVNVEGAWTSSAKRKRGAFVFETPVGDFGVELGQGETDVTLDPASNFLAAAGVE